MESSQLSPHLLQDGERSWTVKFSKAAIGAWTWEATHADGRTAGPVMPDAGLYFKKEKAEEAAVRTLMAAERGDLNETISGFDLQIRVRERDRDET